MSVEELRISQKIASGFSVSEESSVIPKNRTVTIYIFEASCPDSALATARIEYGEQILWVIQRDSQAPTKIEVKGDGINKLELICENDCGNEYYFNAFAKIGF